MINHSVLNLQKIVKILIQALYFHFRRDFVHFSKICFKSFGDRVKYWTTINQPNIAADLGYLKGKFPPGHCSQPFGNCYVGNSDVEPLIAIHNMILSHAMAVGLYRKHFQVTKTGLESLLVQCFLFLT